MIIKEFMSYCKQALTTEQKQFAASQMKRKVAKSFQKGGGCTHFLSLPLAMVHGVGDVYKEWREKVIAKQYPGLLPRLLIGPRLLHVTLCMLPLSEAG